MSNRNRGFTFIELLVAVLVLGIGLVGVAGLQSIALGMNHGSYLRSQATLLAHDVADRMRANSVAVRNGSYDMGASGSASQDTNCESAVGCGVGALAGHDLYEWTQRVQAVLPSGQGVVCVDSTPMSGTPAGGTPGAPDCDGTGDNYAIKIWWLEKEDNGNQRVFVTEFRP